MHYAIIAAGKGSRLAEEGVALPKPLVMINGESLVYRLIRIFSQNNAERIFIICNEEMTEVAEYISNLKQKYPAIHLLIKSTPSSMHSLYELTKEMKKLTDEGQETPRLVLTTVDTIFNESEFATYVRTFESDAASDAVMGLTKYIDDEKPLYVGVENTNDESRITGYYDTQNGCTHISAGIYGLTSKTLPVLNRCIEEGQSRMRRFQRALVEEGLSVKPFVFSKVFDIDHASDIEKASSIERN